MGIKTKGDTDASKITKLFFWCDNELIQEAQKEQVSLPQRRSTVIEELLTKWFNAQQFEQALDQKLTADRQPISKKRKNKDNSTNNNNNSNEPSINTTD